ncbi:hypothetical protein GL263_27710, partial [Streptomyces durbertensis]|nr:hypothetical protein [Streptomyces durbertensis]
NPENPENEARGDGQGNGQGEGGGRNGSDRPATPWGRQWSSRQPGRSDGGFGSGPGNGDGNGGRPDRRRWDPKDPAQRHARYALLAGMWGFFFALFNLPPVALLLGALSLYWGISALRGAPGVPREGGTAADGGTPPGPSGERPRAGRQQVTAASVGLVVGSLALLVVASTFALQLVYKDYYD